MKICVLSPGVVHAVPRTLSIADQFDEVYFIDVAGKSDVASLDAYGVKCYKPEIPNSLLSRSQLKQLFKVIEPDVIVCHFASGDHFFDAIAYSNCPVTVIAMGQDVLYEAGDSDVSHFRRLLTRMALRRTIYVSAKSQYLAKRISQFGVKAIVDVNYWGADLELFSPGDKCEARRQLGWDEERFYILSPRAIEPRLNIDVIVDAFSKVLNKYPGAKLVIIGRADSDYLQSIKEQIAQLGISDNILFLGEVTQEMLPIYYRASDVVLSMASSEGFPNTVLEVMACRIPVVVGRIKQVEELLEDGGNSILCEISVDGIAASLVKTLNDDALTEKVSEEGLSTVLETADIRKNGMIFSKKIKNTLLQSDASMTILEKYTFRFMYLIYRIHRKFITA